jgi:membrane protein
VSGVETLQANTDAPDPDHPAKPKTPRRLNSTLWKYALKRTVKEFSNDQCTDMAAALTYYGVLSMFPAFVALISILGVFGNGKATVDTLMDMAQQLAPGGSLDTLRSTLDQLTNSPGSGIGLVVGLLGAIWSASGFVGAFGRTMNRIYEVPEGRPIWKLRPQILLVTVIMLILVAIAAASLVLTGPVAQTVGDVVGLGSTAVTVWNIAKWPLLLLLVVIIIAILYYATPNVRQPKFRWMSTGALVAIVVWVIVSVGFGLYVANFSNYNKTYGSLAGVIVFLLWLWLGNLALLFGAEVDSELERGRQLQAGMDSEGDLQLPVRDDRKVRKSQAGLEKLIGQAKDLRQHFGRTNGTASEDGQLHDSEASRRSK